jgi:hypothetical protein
VAEGPTGDPGDGAAAAGLPAVAVEAGEGHGPRKEFFVLAGRGMVAEAAEVRAAAAALQLPRQRARRLRSHPEGRGPLGVLRQPGPAGQQLIDSQLASSCSHTGCSSICRLVPTPPLPLPLPQGGAPPLFVHHRQSGACWYNGGLAPGAEAAQAYRCAGWLLAQSLANRAPLGCQLAPLVLQKLLLGDLFKVGYLRCVHVTCRPGAAASMAEAMLVSDCATYRDHSDGSSWRGVGPGPAFCPQPQTPSVNLPPSPPVSP